MANPEITHFPVGTTDQHGNELIEGLCPILYQDVRANLLSPSTVAPTSGYDNVVSEFGIIKGLYAYMQNYVSGFSLGTGPGEIFNSFEFNYPSGVVKLNAISTTTDDRVTLTDIGDYILVEHDGSLLEVAPIDNVYVQGGAQQDIINVSFQNTSASVDTYPICANVVSSDPNIKMNYNKDIAIAKMAWRVGSTSGNLKNKNILVGFAGTTGLTGDMAHLGSFKVTYPNVWIPLKYTKETFYDQYEYFSSPDEIIFTTEDNSIVSGDVEFRIFYDQINYAAHEESIITLSASVNDSSNPINYIVTGDGYIETRWYEDSYINIVNEESYIFTVEDNSSVQYYGDKNERVKFLVSSGDNVNFYIDSLSANLNTGVIKLKMQKETY